MPTAQICIATHKPYSFPTQQGYTPIFAGRAADPSTAQDIQGDNTGDNISTLNPHFCELTVLYWMWKNCHTDIQGLVHYRRYFVHSQFCVPHMQHNVLDIFRLPEMLPNEKHIILPQPQGCGRRPFLGICKRRQTVYENYAAGHYAQDWQIMKQTLHTLYPQYSAALTEVENTKKISFFNMFIAHKTWVNNYCQWLFPLLFAIQQRVALENYSAYQARIFGFLAERLLNVYICHHRKELTIHYLPVKLLE